MKLLLHQNKIRFPQRRQARKENTQVPRCASTRNASVPRTASETTETQVRNKIPFHPGKREGGVFDPLRKSRVSALSNSYAAGRSSVTVRVGSTARCSS